MLPPWLPWLARLPQTSGWASAALALALMVACGPAAAPASPAPSVTATATPSPGPPPGKPPVARPLSSPPARDLVDLARRFRRVEGAPEGPTLLPAVHAVGDAQELWLLDPFAPSVKRISTVLRLATPHAYFYVQDGATLPGADLSAMAQNFEEAVYPQVARYFGQERSPGIDNDSHLTIVLADIPGLGGYFNDGDAYPSAVAPYSNQREMIYANARMASGGPSFGSLLAHELQHLIHWSHDPDEDVWVNEGLSEVAGELVGGAPLSTFIRRFMAAPDTQLNAWDPLGSNTAHYGASHLYFRYLLDRYGGRENAWRLIARPEDGIDGVNAYLGEIGAGVTFEDVFADWLIANFLDEEDGPYSQAGLAIRMPVSEVLKEPRQGEGTVHQFAADYIEVSPAAGDFDFVFQGDATAPVIATAPHSGRAFWWSGRGDAIDTTLTRKVDLTGLTSATLRFWTWFDIEQGWDYGYVAASTDGGQTWRSLDGAYTSSGNPVGQSYGPGYTGRSDGWREEAIDLSPFAGQAVLLRFEYVTDNGISGPGWAIDDVAIPELGFRDGVEGEEAGWEALGFQQVSGPLPQRFILQVIELRPDGRQVRRIPLDAQNSARVRLSGFTKAIVVVAGATDGTTELAHYRYALEPAAN